jgi:hypothetical protein
MSLRDVTGIFSRSFVVGYFTPALAAWTTVIILTRESQPERFTSLRFGAQAVVVAALSLLVGGVLLGLRYDIRMAFVAARFLAGPIRDKLMAHEVRRLEAARRSAAAVGVEERTRGYFVLDQEFPDEHVRPTRFGNAFGAYQAYPFNRYGLDYSVAWKRIDVLLSPREVELQALARSDVDFLLNLSVLGVLVALTLAVERLVHASPAAAVSVVPLMVSWVTYRLAVRAERRLGHEQRASFDLHRLELYEQLGMARPRTAADERATAEAVNLVLQWRRDGQPAPFYGEEYPSS